jgi:hypothetical protein
MTKDKDKGRDLHSKVDKYRVLTAEAKAHIKRLCLLDYVECEYTLDYSASDRLYGGSGNVIRINAPISMVIKHLEGDVEKFSGLLQEAEMEYLDWVRNGK